MLLLLEACGTIGFVMTASEQLDLSIYRMGGALALAGSEQLYGVADPASGLVFTYPPFAAVVSSGLTAIGDEPSRIVMILVSLAAVARVAWLVMDYVPRGSWLGRWNRMTLTSWFVAISLISEPYVSSINFGQVNLVLLWAVIEAALSTRPITASVIGIAAGIKLVPVAFIAMLVMQRRLAHAVWAISWFLASVLVGVLVLPGASWCFWTDAVWNDQRIGGIAYVGNQSLNGALWRLSGPGGSLLLWVAMACVIAVVTARITVRSSLLEGVVAVALASLLLSPVSWTHHWVWISIAVLVAFGRGNGPRSRWALVAAGWAVAQLTWIIWWFPHGGDVEYDGSIGMKLAADVYAVLAIATLLGLATTPRGRLLTDDRPVVEGRRAAP